MNEVQIGTPLPAYPVTVKRYNWFNTVACLACKHLTIAFAYVNCLAITDNNSYTGHGKYKRNGAWLPCY